MVKLQKLVLRNFKSFRKADIPLSRGFTAIVGSNGSGKTNILDGLLFALGISSMKMLRVSRLEELVNNDAVENYTKAELSLRDKDKTYLVQRLIDKQGKSVYRLDGKRKTRNEISSLLLELGVRPEGHNIVVQGDSTRIIEMSPVERRQIIDELAGLQEFDAKKEEALKELQKVDNKLRDAGIVMQEREIYLEELRKDKEAAAEFENFQLEAKRIKATLLFGEIENIEKMEKENNEKLILIEEGKNKLDSETEQDKAKKTGLKQKSDSLNKEILGLREKTYATIGAQLEEARTHKALLRERIENRQQLLERNNAGIAELEEKKQRTGKQIESQKLEVKKIEGQLPVLQKKIKEAAERKAAVESNAAQKEKKLKEMNNAREALSHELELLQEQLFEKQSLLNILQKETLFKKQAMREAMQFSEVAEARVAEKEKKAMLLSQLRERYGKIAEVLALAEKEREHALDALKEAEAERKSLVESIQTLGKSFATCPVCESELRKEKKQAIAAKKEERLKAIMEREQRLRQRKQDSEAKLAEVKNAAEKANLLAIEASDLQEQRAQLQQNREKLSAIKQWLGKNSPGSLQNKTAQLKEKVEAKKASLSSQAEKIKAFQQSLSLEKLQQVSEALTTLQKEAIALEHQKENLVNNTANHLQNQIGEATASANLLGEENQRLARLKEQEENNSAETDSKIALLESKVSEAEIDAKKIVAENERVDKSIVSIEEASAAKQARLRSLSQEENSLLVEKSKQEVRLADLREETAELQDVQTEQGFDAPALNERQKEISKKIEQLGAINMKALESFNMLEAEVSDVRKKVEKLDAERLAVVEMIEKIDVQRTSVFMQCFSELNKNFSKMFNNLFNGEGMLQLSNAETPLQAGLLIQAKHKGNSIKSIDSMSGGEKSLTALAFLFAIQLYEPAPFYVFDEADAALDKENSAKMAKIIKEISKQSQFIAITHNDPLVQEADQIIGVALNKQKSSVIGLKLREKMVAGP